jgi:hypothetical protein
MKNLEMKQTLVNMKGKKYNMEHKYIFEKPILDRLAENIPQ